MKQRRKRRLIYLGAATSGLVAIWALLRPRNRYTCGSWDSTMPGLSLESYNGRG